MKFTANGTAVADYVDDLSHIDISFNARTKRFSKAIDSVKLDFEGLKSLPTILLGRHTTQADQQTREFIDSIQRAVVIGATTIVTENIWGSLPTYASYVNLEELYDVDETKDLYLQAAAKRGW